MRPIIKDTGMIAKCGLYCGACSRYLKEKCNGCATNEKAASWCKLRTCCQEKNIPSCADCTEYTDVMACKKYNTVMAKLFGFVFNSDRQACIQAIRSDGYEAFVSRMAREKKMTFPRR